MKTFLFCLALFPAPSIFAESFSTEIANVTSGVQNRLQQLTPQHEVYAATLSLLVNLLAEDSTALRSFKQEVSSKLSKIASDHSLSASYRREQYCYFWGGVTLLFAIGGGIGIGVDSTMNRFFPRKDYAPWTRRAGWRLVGIMALSGFLFGSPIVSHMIDADQYEARDRREAREVLAVKLKDQKWPLILNDLTYRTGEILALGGQETALLRDILTNQMASSVSAEGKFNIDIGAALESLAKESSTLGPMGNKKLVARIEALKTIDAAMNRVKDESSIELEVGADAETIAQSVSEILIYAKGKLESGTASLAAPINRLEQALFLLN